jgi:D-cysteine desulfhydrase
MGNRRMHNDTIPLFRNYHRLEERLPYVSLGILPTPVEEAKGIADALGVKRLFIKRDDLSGAVYGGNKVRKLEFLLGQAVRSRARDVMTIGFAGSNHALATAIYARQLGLGSTSLLLPQENAHYLRRNLLASYHHGATLCHYERFFGLFLGMFAHACRGMIRHGACPRLIPPGGSCPLGVVGYVNAALELKEQIAEGLLPEPDVVYVPLGSMGTSAGLIIGFKAAGLTTRVVPVRVIEEKMAGLPRMKKLINKTVSLLRRLDPSFPVIGVSRDEFHVRDDCLGEGYAHFTEKAVRAAALVHKEQGIVLNGTYSAKAFSALVDDAGRSFLKEKTVLFWNTYNSRDLVKCAEEVDYHRLPKAFHRYFEGAVQALDHGEG